MGAFNQCEAATDEFHVALIGPGEFRRALGRCEGQPHLARQALSRDGELLPLKCL